MKGARVRYVSFALLLVASTASAADWQEIARLDSGGVLQVDVADIVEVKGFRKAWSKSIYTADQPVPAEFQGAVRSAQSYRSVQIMSFSNCAERTSAVAEYRWYDADGKGIGNIHLDQLIFRKVQAGTPDEQMLDAICKSETARPVTPLEEQASMSRPVNPDDYYPAAARRRGEQGAPIVKVCVGPTGKLLREPEITDSSGYPELDAAVIRAAKATRYRAGTRNGAALPESCITFKIKFTLTNR